jgi:hypothetical protein
MSRTLSKRERRLRLDLAEPRKRLAPPPASLAREHPSQHSQHAVKAHAERPFHHASAFIRFRPYGAEGEWSGANPLAGDRAVPAPLA